jgi:hypothetical protein
MQSRLVAWRTVLAHFCVCVQFEMWVFVILRQGQFGFEPETSLSLRYDPLAGEYRPCRHKERRKPSFHAFQGAGSGRHNTRKSVWGFA